MGHIPALECLPKQVAKAILGGSMNNSSQTRPKDRFRFLTRPFQAFLKMARNLPPGGHGVRSWELGVFLLHTLSSWRF